MGESQRISQNIHSNSLILSLLRKSLFVNTLGENVHVQNVTPPRCRWLNGLVQAGHIGSIGRDHDLSFGFAHRFFKILREHLFRRGKPGPVSAKAIRNKCRDALLYKPPI